MQIGNGEATSVWGDAWLCSDGTGQIITTRPFSSTLPDKVADLIDWDLGNWNFPLI